MTTVVFTEKNKAAARIAKILNSDSVSRTSVEGVQVYDFKKNSRQWRVMGLVGRT
jgi:DNA topoisomerase-1